MGQISAELGLLLPFSADQSLLLFDNLSYRAQAVVL